MDLPTDLRRFPFGKVVLFAFVACVRAHPDASAASVAPDPAAAGGQTTTTSAESDDEPSVPDATPTPAPNTPPEPPPADAVKVYAFNQIAPIFSASEWPVKDQTKADDARKGVIKVGYLRRGAFVYARPAKIEKSNCLEGWWHLYKGGYICGKYATNDPKHKELRFAPHAPWLDKDLPYEYGLNLSPGTPLYRRIPLKRERKEQEKTLAVGRHKKTSDIVKEMKDRGEEVPAYLKEAEGKEKAAVSFGDLKGDTDLVQTRMLKGFYLSIDKKIEGHSGLMWRTTMGYFAPKDHVIVHEHKTEFEGVELGSPTEKRKLPYAFVVSTKATQISLEGHKPHKTDPLERFGIHVLTGKREPIDGQTYWETEKGFWVRGKDVAIVAKPKVPNGIGPNEKWIDVDLTNQSLVAFEGEKPVFATVVSTGRHDKTDKEKDHSTVEGNFRIREKHVSTTMDDDAASDGTYRIEDVPWVMYFEKSFALHGAFWHSRFGREKSHGCVNLTPHDARWIFMWSGPHLPESWHGVKATKENPGTRVVVHK